MSRGALLRLAKNAIPKTYRVSLDIPLTGETTSEKITLEIPQREHTNLDCIFSIAMRLQNSEKLPLGRIDLLKQASEIFPFRQARSQIAFNRSD
jgi:hypothetical protein